jgi:hypothetical protein
VRAELRAKLEAWMKEQGDEGQATELKALERMPKGSMKEEGEGEGAGKKAKKKGKQ